MNKKGIENIEIRKVVHEINNELTKVSLLAEELIQRNDNDRGSIQTSANKIIAAAQVAAISSKRLMSTLRQTQNMPAVMD